MSQKRLPECLRLLTSRLADNDVVMRLCHSILYSYVVVLYCFITKAKYRRAYAKENHWLLREGVCVKQSRTFRLITPSKGILIPGQRRLQQRREQGFSCYPIRPLFLLLDLRKGRFDRPTIITLPPASPQTMNEFDIAPRFLVKKGSHSKSSMFRFAWCQENHALGEGELIMGWRGLKCSESWCWVFFSFTCRLFLPFICTLYTTSVCFAIHLCFGLKQIIWPLSTFTLWYVPTTVDMAKAAQGLNSIH